MKNIIIKISIMCYFCLAPLAMNQAMGNEEGTYYYRLNAGKKEALNVVTNPLPAGRRVSWGNCSGETTTELNQQGQACETVSNDVGGYTGTTEVCASPVGNPLLNNSACYQDCNAGTLEWSSGQCKADVITSVHNQSRTISNTTTQYTGSGTFICEDGTWKEQTNTCTENDSVCGTDNNQTLGSIPTNLCSFGTASTVSQTSDTYSWTCTNVLKTTSCSAIKAPVCDNSTYQGCSIGTASAYTSAIGASTVTWNCSSGTQTIACSKQAVVGVAGVCGTDNSKILSATPTSLCSSGTATSVLDVNGKYTWSCNGELATDTKTKGADVNCSSDKLAICDNTTFKGCTLGTASEYTSANGDINSTWTCTNHSSIVNCTKPKDLGVNGVCGPNNGATLGTTPSTNLCSVGTATTVLTNATTYSWTCNGTAATSTELAGSNASCSATRTAVCNTATFGGCTQGTSAYTSAIGASTVAWNCTSGSSTANCTKAATIGVSGSCGSSNGTITSTAPSTNLCATGTQTSVTNGANSFTWSCTGETATQTRTAGSTSNCSATKTAVCDNTTFQGCSLGSASAYTSAMEASTATWNCVNGSSSVGCSKAKLAGTAAVCGSSNGGTYGSAPSSGLCSSGTASGVTTGGTSYTWSCTGSAVSHTNLAGSNASCSATRTAVCNTVTFGGCTQGTSAYTSAIGASTVTWNCTSGSSTANCSKSANTGSSGTCGSANGTISGSTPTSLCSSGYGATSVSLSAGWYSWSCYGQPATQTSTTGSTTSCGATKQATCDNSTFQNCGYGIASAFTSSIGSSTATWNCENGSSVANCSKAKSAGTNGVCGSSNGGTFASAPTSGLCSSGTASGVSGSSTYSWTCSGSSASHTNLAGGTASCSATGANWIATSASCGSNYDSGAASCGSWTPAVSTQSSSFGQSQSCSIPQARTCQPREYDTVSGTYRNVGSTYTENMTAKTYNNSRTVTVSDSGWVNSGGLYSCYGYTPDPSTINSGQTFTQNGYCKQNQIATYTYSVGGSYQYNSRTIDVAHSRSATGTKPISGTWSSGVSKGQSASYSMGCPGSAMTEATGAGYPTNGPTSGSCPTIGAKYKYFVLIYTSTCRTLYYEQTCQ